MGPERIADILSRMLMTSAMCVGPTITRDDYKYVCDKHAQLLLETKYVYGREEKLRYIYNKLDCYITSK